MGVKDIIEILSDAFTIQHGFKPTHMTICSALFDRLCQELDIINKVNKEAIEYEIKKYKGMRVYVSDSMFPSNPYCAYIKSFIGIYLEGERSNGS